MCTHFQIKVWESLLKIPTGDLSTYGDIAKTINNPKAARAVGTAIGANPIAFLIEQAGGLASDGNTAILDIVPDGYHMRVPFIFGSADEVDTYQSQQ